MVLATLALSAWETGPQTGSPDVGAGAGAAAGARRLQFDNNTTGMLIGGAVGGLAGNMTLDRQREERQRAQREAERDAAMRGQVEFERQRALQQEQVRRELEERHPTVAEWG